MKLQIMLGFIAVFAAISYMIPTPMFPGNYVCGGIGRAVQVVEENVQIFSSLFNGLFYGGIMGLIFFGASRKIKNY
ncbi:MAG: hypothetical protein ACQCN5_07135 [Candidatus Bathyarchaeia archaeon]|jgi:hypothetical protein